MQHNILEYLEKTVIKFPNKIAVEDENGSVTFRQLRQNALSISNFLIKNGYSGCKPVPVLVNKSIMAIECFLGVLYAGGFYVPLDVSNPKRRIHSILENIAPDFMLLDNKYKDILSGLNNTIKCLVVNEDVMSEQQFEYFSSNIDTDPAYLINTSGSTGNPKGVVISHRSVIDYIDWASDTYGVNESHIIGNQAPFVFDNSVLDIYLMISTGAKLILIPDKTFMFPVNLINYIDEKKISFIFWVPSIMLNVMKVNALKSKKSDSLSHILFAGEVMHAKVLNYWREHYPLAIFPNLYGPTEITVDCTYYIFERNFDNNDELPIGFPCKNSDILILNEDNNLVSTKDKIGELCVRGSSLALGYYNDFEKTSSVFIQNPLNKNYPERIYRTGDLVCYNELGEILYKGRKDFQIKHMGYRIELGEIENAILSLNGIDNGCVMYDREDKKIVLLYESKQHLSQKDILLGLHDLLPKYMLPNKFIMIEKIPLNINGKIDRARISDEYTNA